LRGALADRHVIAAQTVFRRAGGGGHAHCAGRVVAVAGTVGIHETRGAADRAVACSGAIGILGADLVGLAAMAADDRAVADRRAKIQGDTAVADVGAVCLRHAARAAGAAGAGLWHALGILGATRARLDAAMARVGRADGRRAGRDWRTRVFRIGRQQVAARRVVSDAAHLRPAGLRVREHARLVERAAAGLRPRRAGLCRAVARLRARTCAVGAVASGRDIAVANAGGARAERRQVARARARCKAVAARSVLAGANDLVLA